MTPQEKIGEELDYSILNYELDVNTWKVKLNQTEDKNGKAAMQERITQLEEALDMLKIKKGFFDEIRGSAKN